MQMQLKEMMMCMKYVEGLVLIQCQALNFQKVSATMSEYKESI